jgi:hypothetical protein
MSVLTKLRAAVRVRVIRIRSALARALSSLGRVSRDGVSAACKTVAPHASQTRAVFAAVIDALSGHLTDPLRAQGALADLARAYVALLAAATLSHLIGLPVALTALVGLTAALAKAALIGGVAASLIARVAGMATRQDVLHATRVAAAAGLLWLAGACYVMAGASCALGLAVRPMDLGPVAAVVVPAEARYAEAPVPFATTGPEVAEGPTGPAGGRRPRTRRAATQDVLS